MKILIIDDEPHICKALQGLLTDQGYEAAFCQNGAEGRRALKQDSYDVLFLDVMLPDANGIEILESVVHTYPRIRVMMMSGHADMATAVQATKLGAHTFFEKPLNPDRVLLELEHLRKQRQLHNQLISMEQQAFDQTILGDSDVMLDLKRGLIKASPSEGRVLILGENGTGKELVARGIHQQSHRSEGPFVSLNCAALPEPLVESELFGYEKGAFTGALQQKAGRFELADGGTLFLDEVGDMGLATQAKLLRVLEEHEAVRVGGSRPYRFDVRVIAATNKDLLVAIEAGEFREDLYYRLNVIPIQVPPLRNRGQDVELLAKAFMHAFCEKTGRMVPQWQEDALELLQNYGWPGNVRELRNVIERLFIMNDGPTISADLIRETLPQAVRLQSSAPRSHELGGSLRDMLNAYEKSLLETGFRETDGNVSELARRLQIDRANLHRKLRQYHIK